MKAAYALLWLLLWLLGAVFAIVLGTLAPLYIGSEVFFSDLHGCGGYAVGLACLVIGPPTTLIAYCIMFWVFTANQTFGERLLRSALASVMISTIFVISWLVVEIRLL